MINTSAVGVAILFLIAATTMVGSSSTDNGLAFLGAQHTLEGILANFTWQDALQAYHRQTNTLSLSQAKLAAPHLLRVVVPEGTSFEGRVNINDTIELVLSGEAASVDLRPYLQNSHNKVVITGHYSPTPSALVVRFEGPDTLVQQKARENGEINFQLNLVVK